MIVIRKRIEPHVLFLNATALLTSCLLFRNFFFILSTVFEQLNSKLFPMKFSDTFQASQKSTIMLLIFSFWTFFLLRSPHILRHIYSTRQTDYILSCIIYLRISTNNENDRDIIYIHHLQLKSVVQSNQWTILRLYL